MILQSGAGHGFEPQQPLQVFQLRNRRQAIAGGQRFFPGTFAHGWRAAGQGHGAQANIALDRAQAADPGYSMAGLLRQAVNAGIPPSELRLPMTPEEVAAAYGHPGRDETAAPQHETSPAAAGEAELEAGA